MFSHRRQALSLGPGNSWLRLSYSFLASRMSDRRADARKIEVTSVWGNVQQGLYTKERVQKGRPVFSEKPLLYVPNVFLMQHPSDTLKAIYDVNPLNNDLMLAGCKDVELFTACHLLLERKSRMVQHVFKTMPAFPNYNAKDKDATFLKKIGKIAGCPPNVVRKAVSQVRRNALSVSGIITGCTLGLALYEFASLPKHSCDPNMIYYFRTNGAVVFIALRDIEVGEELTLSYLRGVYYAPLEARQSELKARFSLSCACPRCIKEASNESHFAAVYDGIEKSSVTKVDLETFNNELSRIEREVNSKTAHVSEPLESLPNRFSDEKSVAQIFYTVSGIVPAQPLAYRHTAALLVVMTHLHGCHTRMRYMGEYCRLVRFVYSRLLKSSEILALPIEVSHMVVSLALLPAILKCDENPFCDGFGKTVLHVIKEDSRDLQLQFVFQAFACTLLGNDIRSVFDVEEKIRAARALWPADYLEIDVLSVAFLKVLTDANRVSLSEHLSCSEKRRIVHKRRIKRKVVSQGPSEVEAESTSAYSDILTGLSTIDEDDEVRSRGPLCSQTSFSSRDNSVKDDSVNFSVAPERVQTGVHLHELEIQVDSRESSRPHDVLTCCCY